MGVAPIHSPRLSVRVCPCVATPLIEGAVVLPGATMAIVLVALDVLSPDPPTFVAVTTTRSVWPASPFASWYDCDVAPLMSEQFAPLVAHRRQRYAYVIGVVPLHVPVEAFSVQPTAAEPVITGAAVFAGGVAPVTTAVAADGFDAEPEELCAVTTTTIVWPTSSMTSVYVSDVAPEMFVQFAPELLQRCH